ncbi:MAG: hypothetical protein ACRCZK_05040 [Oscillospiraceae bacterium]
MPIVKLSLTDPEYQDLLNLADSENMSIQDLIRLKLLLIKNPSIFTPEEASRRALEKFSSADAPFTLPDVYGDEWSNLNPRMTGVFGKKFFNHLKTIDSIEYVGMTPDRRRATYRIK